MAAVHVDPFDAAAIKTAGEKYKNLLKSIADHIGYQFVDEDLKSGYYPTAIQIKSDNEALIREGLVKVLSQPLAIAVKEFPLDKSLTKPLRKPADL